MQVPSVALLEYDTRFERYGSSFVFWDVHDPVALPVTMQGQYDLIVLDPPYLSEE